jgi:hypothetical protein
MLLAEVHHAVHSSKRTPATNLSFTPSLTVSSLPEPLGEVGRCRKGIPPGGVVRGFRSADR